MQVGWGATIRNQNSSPSSKLSGNAHSFSKRKTLSHLFPSIGFIHSLSHLSNLMGSPPIN